MNLALAMNMPGGTRHTLTADDIYDCAGNIIDEAYNAAEFALPEVADRNDVVINEVLFNPTSTGVDFVEVYNRSAKYINLNGWTLANVRGDSLYDLEVVTQENVLLPPASYLVLVEDANILKGEYVNGKENVFFETDLPSMPDDEGVVVVVDHAGSAIDSLSYTEDWHSPFLRDVEGISLERIHFEGPTDDPSNWRSASSAVGYATPGYVNSNVVDENTLVESIVVEPEVFAPNAGQSGFTLIHYDFEKGGLVANIRILDPYGREIKRIANNVLLGTEGFFRWDGDREDGQPARIGPYMVLVQIFSEDGLVRTKKLRIAIAGDFR